MPTLGHVAVVSLENTLTTIIPCIGIVAFWIRVQVGNHKVVDYGLVFELGNTFLCLWERHFIPIIPQQG